MYVFIFFLSFVYKFGFSSVTNELDGIPLLTSLLIPLLLMSLVVALLPEILMVALLPISLMAPLLPKILMVQLLSSLSG